jgi:hypothetical protein
MSRRGLFSVDITSSRKAINDMEKAVSTVLKDKVDKINRKGPSILREAFAQALSSNEKLAKYAKNARSMPAESRVLGHPKLGQGLKLRFTDTGLSMRLLFNPNNFDDEVGFWIVYTAQYGRKALPTRSKEQGPYALAFKPEDVSSQYTRNGKKTPPIHDRRGEPYVAVFAMSVDEVRPWFKWKDSKVRRVETKLKKTLRKQV